VRHLPGDILSVCTLTHSLTLCCPVWLYTNATSPTSPAAQTRTASTSPTVLHQASSSPPSCSSLAVEHGEMPAT
jgi:hypothetical protein